MGRLYAITVNVTPATLETQAEICRLTLAWLKQSRNFSLQLTTDELKPGCSLRAESSVSAARFDWHEDAGFGITKFDGWHLDGDDKGRTWTVRITTARSAESIEFGLEVRFEDEGVHIGRSPPPTQPDLVSQILSRFSVSVAGEPVTSVTAPLAAGDVATFVETILLGDRRLPAVVVSRLTDGRLPLDVVELARKLAGIAQTFVLEDAAGSGALQRALAEELIIRDTSPTDAAFVAKKLGCVDGIARIYWPEFDVEGPAEEQDAVLPQARMVEAIFSIVASAAVREMTVPEFENIRANLQRVAMQKAIQKGDDGIKSTRASLESQIEGYRAENEELRGQLAEAFKQRSIDASAYPDVNGGKIIDALELAESVFEPILEVHPAAKKAARESQSPLARDVFLALSALVRATTRLFDSNGTLGRTFEDEFYAQKVEMGKVKIGMGETASAMAGDYRRDREFTYGGLKIAVEPHVTLAAGDRIRCVQIRFWVDQDRRKLVIFSCGRHARGESSK